MLLREMRRRECRASLEAWCTDVLAPSGQAPAAHHRLLICELEAVTRGDVDRLMVFMPPGAAKSTYCSVLFPPWFLAQHRSASVIAASHTTGFARRWGRRVRNLIGDSAGTLGYGLAPDEQAADRWSTTTGAEYGAFGVGAAVTGRRADLVILDDLVAGHEAADSEAQREATWDWYRGDLYTRLKPGGRIVLIMTRWNPDDIAGRLLDEVKTGGDEWRILKLPAIAEGDDPLGREPGQPLWPEWEDAMALARKRAAVGERGWWSLYQQSPRPMEGSLFKVAMLGTVDAAPIAAARVRRWDLAATRQVGTRDPDWTVGVLMSRSAEGRYTVEDVVRLRGGPDEVEAAIVATAQRDGKAVKIGLPIDPGQAGVAQAQYLTRRLAGYSVDAVRETGDKATRAAPFASQVNVGNVSLVRAPWNRAFLDELAAFPASGHDDQADAASGAFEMVATPQIAPQSIPFSLHRR